MAGPGECLRPHSLPGAGMLARTGTKAVLGLCTGSQSSLEENELAEWIVQ